MPLRASFGVSLGCALLSGALAGCDVGSTHLFDPPNSAGTPSTAMGGGGSGGNPSSGGGGAKSGPGGPCTTKDDCTEQLCSADGHCVDCNEDKDCLTNQYCDQTRCIASAGGSGGGGAGGNGGSAGGSSTGSCNGAQVLFAVQRSGIMFEDPEEDANYWGMVRDAVTGAESALSAFDGLPVGALFFVRAQDNDTCPVLSSAAPQTGAVTSLAELFETNAKAYQELADAEAKMDAPVAEAVAAASSLLAGNARHLVLITTGVADTCEDTDNPCLMDPTIKAVQEAQKAGVTTHIIGMGDTGLLDTESDRDGYQTYLKQLANAGLGKPVKKSSAFDEKCSDDNMKATYSNDNGDAKAYRAESTEEVKSALAEILKSICP